MGRYKIVNSGRIFRKNGQICVRGYEIFYQIQRNKYEGNNSTIAN